MARGEALFLDMQTEAAIADFTKALEVDPTAIQALILRAKAWNRHFQYARAIDDYAEAIRRAADDPAPRRALAWLLATLRRPGFSRRSSGRSGGHHGLRADPLEQPRVPRRPVRRLCRSW